MPNNKTDTDKLLVQELQKGNEKAFRKLFELYWESMFVNAKSIVLNDAAAKDIVQNIWINVWQNAQRAKIENFGAYVSKSVRYGCYKYVRGNKFKAIQLEVIESLQLSDNPEIEHQYDLTETETVIRDSLKKLPPRCRQIFTLSREEDVSNEEIASMLGISKRSVENQMSMALKSIRQSLVSAGSIVSILFPFLF